MEENWFIWVDCIKAQAEYKDANICVLLQKMGKGNRRRKTQLWFSEE